MLLKEISISGVSMNYVSKSRVEMNKDYKWFSPGCVSNYKSNDREYNKIKYTDCKKQN